MDKLKILLIAIGIILLGLYWVFKVKKHTEENTTIIVHDTTVITRLEVQWATDTVVKWYEKPFVKEIKPTIIRQQKIDTVFLDRIKPYDLILGIDKHGTDLKVFAVNQEGMLLKEQLFENVYNNFTAFSAHNRVVVKSSLWEWNGVKVGYEHKRNIEDFKQYENQVDILTGISFLNKYSLDAGIEYNNDLKLKARVGIRLF